MHLFWVLRLFYDRFSDWYNLYISPKPKSNYMVTNTIFLRHGIVGFYLYLLLFIVLGILSLWMKYQRKKLSKVAKDERAIIRKNWVRIPVQYDELEILPNSWDETAVNPNTIRLNKTYNGIEFPLEITIQMATEILRMKIAIQKELSLYYNPQNPDEVFLDLEFLFS